MRCRSERPPAQRLAAGLLLAVATAGALACAPTEAPPYAEVLVLRGTPYERGRQHGAHFASKIRSLYTRLLESSLIPALGRERPGIAEYLLEYQDEARYGDGRFGYEVLLESAYALEEEIPEPYLEEMQGIADGADLPYDEILLLNTFIDTLLGVRTVQQLLHVAQAPTLRAVEVPGLATDGVDNDGDGEVDEADEGRLRPYDPSEHALFVELPTDATVVLRLEDPDGVDPATLRVATGDALYEAGDPALRVEEVAGGLEVRVRPPEGWPPAAVVALRVEAGDRSWVTDPPPAHARFMRPQWITLTTRGYGQAPEAVPNLGFADDRFPPPSLAVALAGSASTDGGTYLAHHFALLDAGVAHQHVAILVHEPTGGIPFVTVGWTGLVWGVSGMNAEGVSWAVNLSDTLDNPLVAEVRSKLLGARLLARGLPVGLVGRNVLARAHDADEAADLVAAAPATGGYNHLVADATGALRAIEVDGNIDHRPEGGAYPTESDTRLLVASHYQVNRQDLDTEVLGLRLPPQRVWSGTWHRSVRALGLLERALAQQGPSDAAGLQALLARPQLVDPRDSMVAAVYVPAGGLLYWAAGQVPATDAPFRALRPFGGPR